MNGTEGFLIGLEHIISLFRQFLSEHSPSDVERRGAAEQTSTVEPGQQRRSSFFGTPADQALREKSLTMDATIQASKIERRNRWLTILKQQIAARETLTDISTETDRDERHTRSIHSSDAFLAAAGAQTEIEACYLPGVSPSTSAHPQEPSNTIWREPFSYSMLYPS